MAAYGIVPLQPPLPTACSLPFQPSSGSQTSILISESFVGLSAAATRQKPGRSRPCGCFTDPAGCASAAVMLVAGSFKDARLSQDTAGASCAFKNAARANGNMGRLSDKSAAVSIFHLWQRYEHSSSDDQP